ncbi:MAG: protein-disulfide reductase DsbD domain-containing protein [Bdellovibrionales bacterium]|jgi:suppressor for copper-sensitivity B
MNRLISLFFLLLALSPAPLWAAASDWQREDGIAVRLIDGDDLSSNNKEITLGLEIQLDEGWHIYWRSAGEAGTPPAITTDGSENIESLTILYPAPRRLTLMGMETIGYNGHVTLPLRILKKEAAKEMALQASLDILTCSTLCVPRHFDLALTPASPKGEEKALIKAATGSLPTTQDTSALSNLKTTLGSNTVQVTFITKDALQNPDLFIESGDELAFSKPSLIPAPDGHGATLTASLLSPLPEGASLTDLPLTITLTNGAAAREITLVPPSAAPTLADAAIPSSPLPFWTIVLLALLGGFILNLMPCVLPVLSIKILSVIKHAGKHKDVVRHSFLASAGGIVFSFGLLAATTIALKESGQAFGWGVQFQQPAFLVFMIALLTFFTANLWGFFEISLPRFILDRVDTSRHPKLAGDFAGGMLATLLATPCSAPFLGTAIGFALAAGSVTIVAVFLALGIGMALPYLAIALWPHLASALPKAGNWMNTLTRVLGFGLLGTAVWLLIVVRAQTGYWPFVLISMAMAGILFALYLRHKNILRVLVPWAIGGALIASLSIATLASIPLSLQKESGIWTPFNEKAIASAVSEGKTVFVDVTADWCLTCKYNKRVVLGQEEVSSRLFGQDGIVTQQADWTSPDPVITDFLHRHGSYGIPFNIVFGPRAPQGIALPELLTKASVLQALDKAKACQQGEAC